MADVRQKLRVLLLGLGFAPPGQIVAANDPRLQFLQSKFDRRTAPPKHRFGHADLAVQQRQRDLRHRLPFSGPRHSFHEPEGQFDHAFRYLLLCQEGSLHGLGAFSGRT